MNLNKEWKINGNWMSYIEDNFGDVIHQKICLFSYLNPKSKLKTPEEYGINCKIRT